MIEIHYSDVAQEIIQTGVLSIALSRHQSALLLRYLRQMEETASKMH